MAYLYSCWGLLNLALTVSLGVVFYRNFRLFTERFGALPSTVLFLLSVSMCSSSGKKSIDAEQGSFSTTIYSPTVTLDDVRSYDVELIHLPAWTLSQGITLSPNNHPDSVKISSFVSLSGFVSGIHWSPIATSATLQSDQRIYYSTVGTFDWQLLNFTVYRQLQQFSGSLPIAKQP